MLFQRKHPAIRGDGELRQRLARRLVELGMDEMQEANALEDGGGPGAAEDGLSRDALQGTNLVCRRGQVLQQHLPKANHGLRSMSGEAVNKVCPRKLTVRTLFPNSALH